MAEANTLITRMRHAVVTGSNKGIGFEICKQLASKGVTVVVTARDEKKGHEAMEKLNDLGLSKYVVNNTAILGERLDWHAIQATISKAVKEDYINKMQKTIKQSDATPEECVETNYYGTKRMVDALIPLLQLSDSPRIVNVSSTAGKLKSIPNDDVRGVLSNAESLTEEKVDELLSEFLKDCKEGSLETKGWPTFLPAYSMSKAAMNAYIRILAKRYPSFRINCVCPGFTKTDINDNTGTYTAKEGAEGPVELALLSDDGPSGFFFRRNEVSAY